MASNQSQKLAQKIWAIANSLRGSMDASKFKDYILGVIFYRYLSARTESYMDRLCRNDGLTYREAWEKPEFVNHLKTWQIRELGYIIEPDDLFDSIVERIQCNSFSIETFERAISKLTDSTIGQESEAAFANLFDAMDLKDSDLGKEVSDRTKLMSDIIQKISDTPFAKDSEGGDVLGTAYMILIGLFQSGAGKKGGEFFTPTSVSTLLAQITTLGLNEVNNVSDGCAGSGSLLLEVGRQLSTHKIGHYYGQEKTGTTYNLLRMNLIMHGVPYRSFTVYNDDTLVRDNFYENGVPVTFDIQVENPPYSAPNTAAAPSFLDDPRYKSAGVLAPKTKADLAFVEGMVYHMSDDGRVAVLLPHGVLFRSGPEESIRRYLIDRLNVIDAVIGLPANMFHGTSIPVCVLFLKKKRNGNSGNILFIDASSYFEKVGKSNALRPSDVKRIVDCVRDRSEIERFSRKVSLEEIAANGYNLNIPRYVDGAEESENWDLYSLVYGGVPECELKPFAPMFECFPSLKEQLFSLGEVNYSPMAEDAKGTVYENPEVKEYILQYKNAVEGMHGFLKEHMIDNLMDINIQAEEGTLTEELFDRLSAFTLVDRYDAYELLNKEWIQAATDIEVIQHEGFEAINAVDPNMITKKKGEDTQEIQDGYKGRILPFELVQKVKLSDDLAKIKEMEDMVASLVSEIGELAESLSEDEKEAEYDGLSLYDKEKNELSSKAVAAGVKALKKQYGKNLEFDEDSIEEKIMTAASLFKKKSEMVSALNKEKINLEEKTINTIRNLSKEEGLELIEMKWITPFIESISGALASVLSKYIGKINALSRKYAVTLQEESASIAETEATLSKMMEGLTGNCEENLALKDLRDFFGGAAL